MALCASLAIKAANRQVAEVLTASATRGPDFKLTPAQRFQVGKRTAKHRIAAASTRFFEKKIPGFTVERNNCYET